MTNASRTGPIRSKNGFKHYAVSSIGVETEITWVDSDGNMYESAETGITAGTTQTQAGAKQLTASWSNVTVCATDGDGVALMLAVVGLRATVKNSGATSLAVWPIDGATDQINALADDLSVNIPPGGQLTFRAIAAGANGIWETNEVLTLPAPTTLRGEFILKATNNDADTVTTLTNAGMGQASVISIPDPGAGTANVLLTDKPNDQSLVTATAAKLNYLDVTAGTGAASEAAVLDSGDDYTWPDAGVLTIGNFATAVESAEHGAGAISTAVAPKTYRWIKNGIIITQTKFDMTDLKSVATTNDVIGLDSGDAYIGRNVIATNGIIFMVELACLESPATGDTDVNVVENTSSSLAKDSAGGTAYLINGGVLAEGKTVQNLAPALTSNYYYYLTCGAGSGGTYSAGMYMLTTWGHPVLA